MKVYELFFKPAYNSTGLFSTLAKAKEYAEQFAQCKWKAGNEYMVTQCSLWEVCERALDTVSEIDLLEVKEHFGVEEDDV
jgi:hypothetical protein